MNEFPPEQATFSAIHQHLEELVEILRRLEAGRPNEREHLPSMDIYEADGEYVIEIELPGVEKEDISLKLCRNVLAVEAVKHPDKGKGCSFLCLERKTGRFRRVIELPPVADVEGIKASFTRGLLAIRLPRLTGGKLMVRDIPVE